MGIDQLGVRYKDNVMGYSLIGLQTLSRNSSVSCKRMVSNPITAKQEQREDSGRKPQKRDEKKKI